MNKTKQLLVIILTMNIALAGAYLFLFYTIKIKIGEVSALSQDLKVRNAKEGDLELLRRVIHDTKDDRGKLQSYFIRSSTVNTLFDSLESLGKESGTDMKLSSPIEQGNVLGINISARGALDDIYYLIKLIEHLPYRIQFKKAYFNNVDPVDVLPQPQDKSGAIAKNNTRVPMWDASFTIEISGYLKE